MAVGLLRTRTVQFLPACALLACAPFACSSSDGTKATPSGGRGGVANAAGAAGTVGTSGSGGASGATGAVGGSGGAAGGAGDQAGADAAGGAGGMAVDGGTDGGAAGARTTKIYDLKSDWSDSQNPSGPWTVMIGTDVAKNLPNWSGEAGQNAYVTAPKGNGHIPVLLKVSATNFEGKLAQKGDLVVHAQDEAGGPGLGQARIVWTAPASGRIDVDASFWLARTSLKRKDVYTVKVAGVIKGMGDVPSNMGVTRDTPAKFSQKGLPIMRGETVELQISHALTCDACSSSPCDGKQGATCAEFCDYLLKITQASQ